MFLVIQETQDTLTITASRTRAEREHFCPLLLWHLLQLGLSQFDRKFHFEREGIRLKEPIGVATDGTKSAGSDVIAFVLIKHRFR